MAIWDQRKKKKKKASNINKILKNYVCRVFILETRRNYQRVTHQRPWLTARMLKRRSCAGSPPTTENRANSIIKAVSLIASGPGVLSFGRRWLMIRWCQVRQRNLEIKDFLWNLASSDCCVWTKSSKTNSWTPIKHLEKWQKKKVNKTGWFKRNKKAT